MVSIYKKTCLDTAVKCPRDWALWASGGSNFGCSGPDGGDADQSAVYGGVSGRAALPVQVLWLQLPHQCCVVFRTWIAIPSICGWLIGAISPGPPCSPKCRCMKATACKVCNVLLTQGHSSAWLIVRSLDWSIDWLILTDSTYGISMCFCIAEPNQFCFFDSSKGVDIGLYDALVVDGISGEEDCKRACQQQTGFNCRRLHVFAQRNVHGTAPSLIRSSCPPPPLHKNKQMLS